MLRKLISLGMLAVVASTALAAHKTIMQITSETRNGGKRATFEVLTTNSGALRTNIVSQSTDKGSEFKREGSGKDKPVIVVLNITPETEAFFKEAKKGERLTRVRFNLYSSEGTQPVKPAMAITLDNPVILSVIFKREGSKPAVQIRFDYQKISWTYPKTTDAADDWDTQTKP